MRDKLNSPVGVGVSVAMLTLVVVALFARDALAGPYVYAAIILLAVVSAWSARRRRQAPERQPARY